MTPLERVMATINLEKADRVPCIPLICGASRRVYGCGYDEWSRDGETAARSLLQAQEILGFDAILTEIDLNVEAADFGQEIIYSTDGQSCPNLKNTLVKNVDDYTSKVKPINPTKTKRMAEHIRTCEILVNEKGDTVPIFGFVYCPLGVLSIIRGVEMLFSECMTHRDEVQKALTIITDVLEDYIRALSKTGIPAIWIETLFAGNKHLDKKLWLDIEGACLRRLAGVTRECGMMMLSHTSIVGFYMDAHIEALNPAAISCAWVPDGSKDWLETKQTWGNKICIIGHIPPVHLFR